MFCTGFFSERRSNAIPLKISVIVFYILVNSVVSYFFNKNFTLILSKSIICPVLLAYAFCKVKVTWAIFSGFCYTFIGLFSETLAVFIQISQGFDIHELGEFNQQRFQGVIFRIIFTFIIIKVILRFRKKDVEKIPTRLMVILLAFPVVTFLVQNYILFQVSPTSNIIFFIGIIILFIIPLVENAIKGKANEIRLKTAEEQLVMQKEHISEISLKQAQIKHLTHDFKQYVHTLLSLIEAGKNDEVIDVLKKLSQEQLEGKHITETGNTMIDALLSVKQEIAERDNIQCDWQIVIPPHLPVNELDACALLGNALDNAIEACRRISNEQTFIKMNMHCESNWLLCSITNPVGKTPDVEKGFFKTLKPKPLVSQGEEHGIGLQSMERCCKNMGGDIEIFYDEERFTVRFMLPFNVIGA
jgi:hypothetical protein